MPKESQQSGAPKEAIGKVKGPVGMAAGPQIGAGLSSISGSRVGSMEGSVDNHSLQEMELHDSMQSDGIQSSHGLTSHKDDEQGGAVGSMAKAP